MTRLTIRRTALLFIPLLLLTGSAYCGYFIVSPASYTYPAGRPFLCEAKYDSFQFETYWELGFSVSANCGAGALISRDKITWSTALDFDTAATTPFYMIRKVYYRFTAPATASSSAHTLFLYVSAYSLAEHYGYGNGFEIIRSGVYAPATINTGPYCTGNTVSLSTSVVNLATYSWTGPGGFSSTLNNPTISTATTSVSGTYSVTTSTPGCSVTTTTNVLVSNPVAPITGTSFVCPGASVLLDNPMPGGTWSSGSPSIATVGTDGVVTGVAIGTATISYSVPGACPPGAATKTVTVNLAADAGSIGGTPSVCVGSATTLSSSVSGGSWSSSNLSVATIGTSGIVYGVASGTSSITYTVTNSCGTASITATVTVNALPDAGTISGTTTMCIDATTALSSTATGGAWSSSNTTSATVSSSTGIVTGVAAGTSTISYSVTNTCGTDVATVVVTVDILSPGISGSAGVCIGTTTSLSHPVGGGTWASSNTGVATVGTSGLVTGIANGTATITYTASAGCFRTLQVTVGLAPITGTTNVCIGTSSILSHPVSGGTWSSSAPFYATVDASTGIVTGVHTGNTVITYTVSAGCYRTTSVYVSNIFMSVSGSLAACAGSTSALTSGSTGGVWTSGNTSIATINASTGLMGAVTAGTANITYTVGSCQTIRVATVNALPDTIGGSSGVCAGSSVTLSNATGGGAWSSSNTAKATVGSSSGVVTGIGAGTVNISYTASGCSRVKTITIGAIPAAITGTLTMCEGNTTSLSTTTTGGTWSSGSTGIASVSSSSGTPVVITGIAAGTADISYNHSGGCVRTATVTVNAAVGTITGNTSICIGGTATLSNATGGGTWTSSTTAKATVGSASGIVTGVAAGTATITYRTGTTCFTTIQVTVSTASAISGTTAACIGLTTELTHATGGGTWSSSNTAIATVDAMTGVVTGVAAGAVNITYEISPGCFATKSMMVYNLPAAISGTPTVCAGAVRTLTSGGGTGTWSTSDSAVATVHPTLGQVTGVSAGVVTITFRRTATGCYVTREVTVNATPDVIMGSTPVCTGSATTYTNSLSGGVWSSSSASVMTIDSTSGNATAVAGGGTTIRYTMPTGCMVAKPVTVNAIPATIGGTNVICVGNMTVLTSATSGGTWTSTDSSIATIVATTAASCTVIGVNAGMVTINYMNAGGCSRSATVTVNAALPASTGATVVCVGNVATLSNSTTGGTWASSTPAKATVGMSTGIVTGVATGTSNITYSIGAGCKSITQVTINAATSAISGAASVCAGQSTTFTSTDAGGSWSSANESIAAVNSSGVVTGVAAGTTTITYAMSAGCYKTKSITVKALPSVSGSSTVMAGAASTLSGTPTGGVWASSATGIATAGVSSGIVTGISVGDVTITYTSGGCSALWDMSVFSATAGRPALATSDAMDIFSVYPNPTSGYLSINTSVTGMFGVWATDGKLIQQYTISTGISNIELPYGLSPGVYFYHFNGADGTIRTKSLVYKP